MKRNCVTFVSDKHCRYYVIPTSKEASFKEWEASVIGGQNDEEYTGEDFLDYRIGRPLATLVLTKPYRRIAARRRAARLRGLRGLLALLFLSLMGWTASQAAPFYTSGNDFLRTCDPDGAFIRSQSSETRTWTDAACTLWVVGVAQGVGVEDQMRPVVKLSERDAKAAKEYEQSLEKQYGIKPNAVMPNANVCIPDNATNGQYLLVVLAYMKSHPEDLTSHAALLAVAALKTAWACPVK